MLTPAPRLRLHKPHDRGTLGRRPIRNPPSASGSRVHPTPLRTLVAVLLLAGVLASPAAAQFPTPPGRQSEQPIFNRFAGTPDTGHRRQRLFEVPVALRPQTNADADIDHSLGLGYYVAAWPLSDVYVSLGMNYYQAQWAPVSGDLSKVNVKQFDLSQQLNFRLWDSLVLSLGLGVGVMDALVEFDDGDYEHRQAFYVPVQMGFIVPLGDTYVVSLRAVQSPFVGNGPVISHARAMLGFGYNY